MHKLERCWAEALGPTDFQGGRGKEGLALQWVREIASLQSTWKKNHGARKYHLTRKCGWKDVFRLSRATHSRILRSGETLQAFKFFLKEDHAAYKAREVWKASSFLL